MTDIQNKTTAENLTIAESKMQKWQENEFMPYKKAKEQEKQNFNEFAKIIVNNTQEIKFMLANIYDKNSTKAVATWNELKLEPQIKDIKLNGDMLMITDVNSKELSIKFEDILTNIAKVLEV